MCLGMVRTTVLRAGSHGHHRDAAAATNRPLHRPRGCRKRSDRLRTVSGRSECPRHPFDRQPQLRRILPGRTPDRGRIDPETVVGQYVAKAGDRTPWHGRPGRLERPARPLRRLRRGLRIAHDRILHQARIVECRPPSPLVWSRIRPMRRRMCAGSTRSDSGPGITAVAPPSAPGRVSPGGERLRSAPPHDG